MDFYDFVRDFRKHQKTKIHPLGYLGIPLEVFQTYTFNNVQTSVSNYSPLLVALATETAVVQGASGYG